MLEKSVSTNVTLTLFVGHCVLAGVPVLIQLHYREHTQLSDTVCSVVRGEECAF
jgi:hypothetical protein